jgi:hypothetical protein
LKEASPIVSYIIWKWKEAYWLEAWNHLWNQSFKNWIRNVKNFLLMTESVWKSFWATLHLDTIPTFEFVDEIIPKSQNFVFTKDFYGFTHILSWEIYAQDGDKIYKNTFWNNIYIWLTSKTISAPDWVWFLFKKIDT